MSRPFIALVAAMWLIFAIVVMCPEIRRAKASYALTGDEAVSIICAHPWPCEEALAVAWRESNWTPDAYNPGCRCTGLFQIAGVHGFTVAELSDPYFNVATAYSLYRTSGWAPWRAN